VRPRYVLPRALVTVRSRSFFIDLSVGVAALAVFFSIVHLAQYWMGRPVPSVEISQSIQVLPRYAFFSVVRIVIAYILSLAFAIGYGYIAAYNRRVEPLMVAILDILQSIPVLSFLPGVMLAMVSLIPTRQLGIEMGAILLIFTGQVWNIAFSFYSSLKSIPRELREAVNIYRFSAWQRFWHLELPYAAIGLIWNSIISVAGGWFFLITCEMFVLGKRDFRLPGLGSYIQTAASTGNAHAMFWGLLTVILIVVATDQLIWRPIIAWSDRFKFEQTESDDRITSPILEMIRQSTFLEMLSRKTITPVSEKIYARLGHLRKHSHVKSLDSTENSRMATILWIVVGILAACAILYTAFHSLLFLRQVALHDVLMLLAGASATFLRVALALLLASAWTIPVGVAIGFNQKLARVAQPLAQVLASVPATALFPVLLLALVKVGAGLGIGSIVLMLLGTQWYILFNVIAGTIAIPSDLREAADLFRFSKWQRWKTLILPGIFPYLVTGLITASGGAWNASIVAEYFHLQDQTLKILGLGAQISAATDAGRYPILLLATIIMALMVVTTNRLVWRRMYRLAETKYKLET
jgi:NitT/TauT family transport system permease protein